MTEWRRGAQAGIVGGIVWGIITAVEDAISTSPVGAAGPTILILAIIRVAWGVVLGVVFAAIADGLIPGTSYRNKGVVYGLVLGIAELALNLGEASGSFAGVAVNLAVGLASSLVFGYLLGYYYERFAPEALPTIK